MPSIVILAAGLGSRYGGDKQLDTFGQNQRTLMEYNLINASQAGFDHVIFVIRPEIEETLIQQVIPRLHKSFSYNIVHQTFNALPLNCTVQPERKKPLGTAHALWCCKELLNERFAVINADDYYGALAFRLLHQQSNLLSDEHLLVAYQLEKTLSEHGGVNRGLCRLSRENQLLQIDECENIQQPNGKISGKITSTNEVVTLDSKTLVSMNCWLFSTDIFPYLEEEICQVLKNPNNTAECYLPTVVMKQIQQTNKKIRVLESTEQWFGVTYKEDKEFVNNSVNANFASY
mgnify:CR=1 FL=1